MSNARNIVFIAPIPIVHAHSIIDEFKQGHNRFALGSDALPFFDRTFVCNCESENISAYIYVSKSGNDLVSRSPDNKLGIFLKGRLCGWSKADDRTGKYLVDGSQAKRPSSCYTDGPMALFWEIDNITVLPNRKPISDFAGISDSKPYKDHFVPQGPMQALLLR